MAAKPFPILFIGPSRIGDAVLASGLVKKLADEAPGARFTIVVGPAAAPLFTEVPGLDALIVMEKRKGSGHWIALWNRVRGKRWSLVVDMRGSAIASFLRRDRRSVHRKSHGEPVHKVIEAARLLTLEDEPPAPFLYTSDEIEARAAELVGEGGPILAMGPAANWLGKTWPIERFARVAIELLDADGPMAGGRLMILGGPDDARYVEPLARTLPRDRLIDLTGQVDLLTAAGVAMHRVLTRRAGGSDRPDWVVLVGHDSRSVEVAVCEEALTLTLDDGRALTLDGVDWRPGKALFRGRLDGGAFTVTVAPAAEGFVIRHRAAKAKVLVLSPRSAELHGKLPEKQPADTSKMIISPMPGLVVSMDVEVGQTVREGEVVCVIEAMKMQNIIRAEREGVVKLVSAKGGDSVAADEVLVEFG